MRRGSEAVRRAAVAMAAMGMPKSIGERERGEEREGAGEGEGVRRAAVAMADMAMPKSIEERERENEREAGRERERERERERRRRKLQQRRLCTRGAARAGRRDASRRGVDVAIDCVRTRESE